MADLSIEAVAQRVKELLAAKPRGLGVLEYRSSIQPDICTLASQLADYVLRVSKVVEQAEMLLLTARYSEMANHRNLQWCEKALAAAEEISVLRGKPLASLSSPPQPPAGREERR